MLQVSAILWIVRGYKSEVPAFLWGMVCVSLPACVEIEYHAGSGVLFLSCSIRTPLFVSLAHLPAPRSFE